MQNYFFSPQDYAEVKPEFALRDDMFVFSQGPAKGLGKVKFHDFAPVFKAFENLPNVATFIRQISIFKEMLEKAHPDKLQEMDPSFTLPLGEMFSIVVYGQLILEQAKYDNMPSDIINQIFDFMVRDFAGFGLQIYGNHSTNDAQREFCKEIMLIKAVPDMEQYNKIWKDYVLSLNGEYEMNS
jgi:acyl-CoA dehydrogenase